QPADRALLQAEQGRELALGDAMRREQFGQRAGLRGRHGGKIRPRAPPRGAVRRGAQHAPQPPPEPLPPRPPPPRIPGNSCTPQLLPWYLRCVRVASYNYGFGRRTSPQTISSPL